MSHDRFRRFAFLTGSAVLSSLAACAGEAPSSAEFEPLASAESDLYVDVPHVWTNRAIGVCWETSGNDTEKGWVRDAIRKTWERETGLSTWGWTTCGSLPIDGVRIQTADVWPSTSGLGSALKNVPKGVKLNFWFSFTAPNGRGGTYQPFGACTGALRETCIRNIAVHEFGHALGFAHEQARGDTPSTCTDRQAGGETPGTATVGEWDLTSVMNYCNPTWNNAGRLS